MWPLYPTPPSPTQEKESKFRRAVWFLSKQIEKDEPGVKDAHYEASLRALRELSEAKDVDKWVDEFIKRYLGDTDDEP